MITVILDPTGSQHVCWPEAADEVLTLARRFLAQQSSLPLEQQLKDLPALIQGLLTQAETAASAATTGETSRAIAAEILRQKIEQARQTISLIIQRLKGQHAENLAQLEGWGVSTVVGVRGINVRKPQHLKEYITFLRAYVAKETSLPVEQRVADPALATVQALLADLEAAFQNRLTGQNQREISLDERNAFRSQLLQWLKIASLHLVMQNKGVVSAVLQQHGYNVVERSPRSNGENGELPGEPPTSTP